MRDCEKVKELRKKLLTCLDWKETESRSLVGERKDPVKSFCIWILNQLIYQGNFIADISLSWEGYKRRMALIREIERFIAFRDGRMLKHLGKWEEINNVLKI